MNGDMPEIICGISVDSVNAAKLAEAGPQAPHAAVLKGLPRTAMARDDKSMRISNRLRLGLTHTPAIKNIVGETMNGKGLDELLGGAARVYMDSVYKALLKLIE